MPTRIISWVVVTHNFSVFSCTRCEQSYAPKLPCSLMMMEVMVKQFLKEHRTCKVDVAKVAKRMEHKILYGTDSNT